jgi:hypothetical protein
MDKPEFYGDSTRWFIASVIDGSPPAGMEGSVRIRIHGIHSGNTNDIPQGDLPWAQTVIPSTEPGVSGLGRACRLLPGAQVFGVFMDGTNSQTPLVLGSITKNEFPSSVQSMGRDDTATNPFAYAIRDQRTDAVYPFALDERDEPFIFDLEQIVIKFFIDNGYTFLQSVCIAQVMKFISEFSPTKYDTNQEYGIVGWVKGSSRFKSLQEFSRGIDEFSSWDRLDIQLLFVLHELRTTHTAAQGYIRRSDNYYGTAGDGKLRWAKGGGYRGNKSGIEAIIKYYIPNNSHRQVLLGNDSLLSDLGEEGVRSEKWFI